MAYWIRCLHLEKNPFMKRLHLKGKGSFDCFFNFSLIHKLFLLFEYSDLYWFLFRKWHPSFRMHASQNACSLVIIEWYDSSLRWDSMCCAKGRYSSLSWQRVWNKTHAGDAWGGMWETAGLLATAHVQELWEMNSLFKVIYLTFTDGMISSLKRDIMLVVKEGFPCLNLHHSNCKTADLT